MLQVWVFVGYVLDTWNDELSVGMILAVQTSARLAKIFYSICSPKEGEQTLYFLIYFYIVTNTCSNVVGIHVFFES